MTDTPLEPKDMAYDPATDATPADDVAYADTPAFPTDSVPTDVQPDSSSTVDDANAGTVDSEDEPKDYAVFVAETDPATATVPHDVPIDIGPAVEDEEAQFRAYAPPLAGDADGDGVTDRDAASDSDNPTTLEGFDVATGDMESLSE